MRPLDWRDRIKNLAPDVIIVLGFLIAGLKYTAGIREILDIRLSDETAYLTRGIGVLGSVFPGPQAAPLYAVWYSLLARFTPDHVALYHLNYMWVTILPPMLFYILLRRFSVSIITSCLFALFLLITYANFAVWPKVNHFALVVLLVFMILASIPKSKALAFAIVALGCLVASYVRPEMYLAFGFTLAISIWLFLFREQSLKNGIAIVGVALLAVGTGLAIGFPLSGNGRSLFAFGQHFSLNWLTWTQTPGLSPWTDWQQILEMNFGKVSSIGEAALRSPGLVARHVWTNVTNFPGTLVRTFALHANLFLPFHLRLTEAYLLPILVMGGIVIAHKPILARLRTALRTETLPLLLASSICVMLVPTTLIISPREHYMVILGTLLLAMLAILIDPFKDRQIKWLHAAMISILIVAITPNIVNLVGPRPSSRPTLEAIQFLRGLKVSEPVHLLDADLGLSTYLSDNFKSISAHIKNKPFEAFREEQQINMIMASDNLLNDSRYLNDAEWKAFQENYESEGFVKLVLPDGKRAVYVDKTILPPAP